MGLFGDDKLQDERIAVLETHVRGLTQVVQASQADLIGARIEILELKAEIDEKVSLMEVDPAIARLNAELGTTRVELEKASTAASESWATLQGGVNDALESLRNSMSKAYEQVKDA